MNSPSSPLPADEPADAHATTSLTERLHHDTFLKTGALQDAILNSANFSSIATDEKGVIQIFNVGAERMLGYAAADVLNQITPVGDFRPAGSHRPRPGKSRPEAWDLGWCPHPAA